VRGHRRQLLQHEAAGQLVVAGEVEVLPLDDEAAPARRAGREGGQVLASGPCAFVILGGSHDLSASVQRLGGGTTDYLRVTTCG